MFASSSRDGTVRVWDCSRWDTAGILDVAEGSNSLTRTLFHIPAFHPFLPMLAITYQHRGVAIWSIDKLLARETSSEFVPHYYANAKVVLIGDTGVGKSGLGLVLSGQPFVATESTHGRRVWVFDQREAQGVGVQRESREVLLWDMAGQPGYRLIHQLYLNEVAVALVVFDSRSETDPFAGVRYWDRALRQAARMQKGGPNPTKFLVAARVDRGSIAVSRPRIEATIRELGFNRYFQTSALEGLNIPELRAAIHDAIDWESLPRVSSNELFEAIKQFLISEKEAGRVLSRSDDLFRSFVERGAIDLRTLVTRDAFERCIDRVANRDLIRRLKFGGFILLQPEYLDAYAAAMVEAAKTEPDGLGFIAEEAAMTGKFAMSSGERLPDTDQEHLLLIATVEELLQHEIALKEVADGVTDLVFPAQFTRERPDAPDVEGKSVVFTFDGPVMSVYATLAVRLCHTKILTKHEMWKNAASFHSSSGGDCGLLIREIAEGQGELTLFYGRQTTGTTRTQFEGYVHAHLMRRALPETISRRQILVCPKCEEVITDRQAQARRERGYNSMTCPVCDALIYLTEASVVTDEQTRDTVRLMDRDADASRDEGAASAIIHGKRASKDYDVFLSYSSRDAKAVEAIAGELLKRGILPWFDRWEISPGTRWQVELQNIIKNH
jgi:small GTP-binding protein